VLSHLNYTVLPNNTIQGGRIAHIGQIYFDQDLLDQVLKVSPYDTNKQFRMHNNNDMIMALASSGGFDPVLEYSLVGNKLEDGIVAWMNFGIDSSNNRTAYRVAAECFESGCKTKPFEFPSLEVLLGGLGKGGKGGNGMGAGLFPPGGAIPTELPKGLVMPSLSDLFDLIFSFGKGGAPKGAPAAAKTT
jgi:hypothetical protein